MPPPENNDQMVTEPTLGDEDLQQWLTSIGDGAEIELPSLAVGTPPPRATDDDPNGGVDDEPDPDDPNGDEPPQEPPAPTAGADADHFVINGQQFAREDIERLYNFDQYMRANPDIAQRVNDAIAPPTTGQPPVSETTTPPGTGATEQPTVEEWKDPEPPDFLDLEDPAQKFQWDTHVATQKTLFAQEQRSRQFFAQQAKVQQQTQARQVAQDMDAALASFKQAHPNFNEDDIAKVRAAAAPFVPGMMAQLAPVEALGRAMEVAAVMDNDLREKVTDPSVRTRTEHQTRQRRKARLGEISGSPRSAPKTESRPQFTSDKDFLNALAAEFSEQMNR